VTPLIIGTAGHIDHGKTSLVKALTGEDTDRLKEEKERGISIDLGFAHFDLPDGTRAGVVDVPGHERFIRNMLAGAHGMDLVLFTVAADDGVMPQTEEHLDIVHLLGVERAIFVITKADLASEGRLHDVEEEIRILIEGTSLADSPILPFSSVTGEGLAELRCLIVRTLTGQHGRESQGYFRLPVDRAFALQGHGLIVTGTALCGEVRVGDHVRALPGDEILRIRSIQVHDQAVEAATHGQRVALNLTGHERGEIVRGQVICHEKLTRTSTRFDAFLEVPPGAAGVKSHQRVRVHAGTSERMGKLTVLGTQTEVGAKQSAYCQITVDEPLVVLRGDRFVVRDETARRTLGGGTIVHPWAPRHRPTELGLQERLTIFHQNDAPAVAAAYIAGTDQFAVSMRELYHILNLREEEVESQLAEAPGIRMFRFEEERLYTTDVRWAVLRDEVAKAVGAYHGTHPLAPGMDMEELRVKLRYKASLRPFRAFVEQLETEKSLAREGNFLRLPGHGTRLGAEEQRIVDRIKTLLSSDPLSPPDLKQLESEMGVNKAKFRELIALLERERSIQRVAPDLYFLIGALTTMKTVVQEYLVKHKELTPAAFRELFKTSRKYTIPLLEFLDREGVTMRVGDVRRLKKEPPKSQ
jgi:selenocysteine-specific elongation factor